MSYNRHRNPELIAAFYKKPVPYQGADPARAKCVFIGLDANFDEHIESSKIFDDVKTYLRDGHRFWREKGIHHPFLLNEHTGDGRCYHDSFAQIGFTPQHADCVSFVELLPFPTYGKSNLKTSDLRSEEIKNHLRALNEIIICGRQRVFIPTSVGNLLRASSYFPWLPPKPTPDSGGYLNHLKLWNNEVKNCVYWHTHFSRWDSSGVKAKMRERPEIRKLCME